MGTLKGFPNPPAL